MIREHMRNPDLLFAGTEYGAYASRNRGGSWTRIKLNLPTVRVDDIQIHPRDNDLIFGTHGRSIWVLDDMTPLEQLNAKVLESDLHLFDVRLAISWRIWNNKGDEGHKGGRQRLFQNSLTQWGPALAGAPTVGTAGDGRFLREAEMPFNC